MLTVSALTNMSRLSVYTPVATSSTRSGVGLTRNRTTESGLWVTLVAFIPFKTPGPPETF
jgi:hypothetical protein